MYSYMIMKILTSVHSDPYLGQVTLEKEVLKLSEFFLPGYIKDMI